MRHFSEISGLTVFTPESYPGPWTRTQNNLRFHAEIESAEIPRTTPQKPSPLMKGLSRSTDRFSGTLFVDEVDNGAYSDWLDGVRWASKRPVLFAIVSPSSLR